MDSVNDVDIYVLPHTPPKRGRPKKIRRCDSCGNLLPEGIGKRQRYHARCRPSRRRQPRLGEFCRCGCGLAVEQKGRGPRRQFYSKAHQIAYARAQKRLAERSPTGISDSEYIRDLAPGATVETNDASTGWNIKHARIAETQEPRFLPTANIADGWCPFRGWPARIQLDNRCPPRIPVLVISSVPVPLFASDSYCQTCLSDRCEEQEERRHACRGTALKIVRTGG